MFSIIVKGGVLMIPILVCSVIALAIFIEKVYHFRRIRINLPEFLKALKGLIREQNWEWALKLCNQTPGPVAHILAEGIKNHKERKERIKEAMEEASLDETPRLEKYLRGLVTIAVIAPLLGLLGTVVGMIKSFGVIGTLGLNQPQLLAGGISEALITTAAGLSIAIPTLIAYHYLSSRVDHITLEMERSSLDIINTLTRSQ